MRSRSWFLAILILILFSLFARVWAAPAIRQVVARVYLPGVMRNWSSAAAPDVGDAPDSSNSRDKAMTAYPGVPAQFPSVVVAGSPPYGPLHRNASVLFCLGSRVTAENEADSGADADGLNNIDPVADRADRDGADDGLLPTGVLTHCASVSLSFNVTARAGAPGEVFLNVWADWDHNGRWGGAQQCHSGSASEWAVRNQALPLLAPGIYTFTTTAFTAYNPYPEKSMWLRMTLSNVAAPAGNEDGSGPQGGYAYGETEDYLLAGSAPQPTPTVTVTTTPPACANAPTLLAPANGALLDTLVPVLGFDTGVQWNADGYELQIARDPAFSPLRYSASGPVRAGANMHDLNLNLEAGVKFYWRVRLKCGQAIAPWSEVWAFTTASGGSLPPAPALTAPVSGTVLVSWPVTLTWSAVPAAVQYRPIWRKASAPSSMFVHPTTGTQVQPWGLEANTLYEWSVSTRSAYGIGPSSVWWRFTTPSTPPPQAVLPRLRRWDEGGSVYWQAE